MRGGGSTPTHLRPSPANRTLPQEAPDVSICDKGRNTSKDTPDLEGDTGVLRGAVIRKGRRRRHPRRPLRFPQGGRRVTQRSLRRPARAEILPTDRSLSRCARQELLYPRGQRKALCGYPELSYPEVCYPAHRLTPPRLASLRHTCGRAASLSAPRQLRPCSQDRRSRPSMHGGGPAP